MTDNISNAQSPALLKQVTPETRARLIAAATIVKYGAGQMIHSRGDDKPGLSIVKSGAVRVGIYGTDGDFVMTSMLGKDHSFGEFTLFTTLPRTHDISAAVDCEIYQVSRASFVRIYDNAPDLARALTTATLIRAHLLLEMLDAIRRLPLLERTAKFLITTMTTQGGASTLDYRQSDFAYMLGVSRVSLNRVLKQLADAGLIQLGYGAINVPSPTALEDWLTRRIRSKAL